MMLFIKIFLAVLIALAIVFACVIAASDADDKAEAMVNDNTEKDKDYWNYCDDNCLNCFKKFECKKFKELRRLKNENGIG